MTTVELQVRQRWDGPWEHVRQVTGEKGVIARLEREAERMDVARWRIRSATVGITLIERKGPR
jgi:hypothetical protein